MEYIKQLVDSLNKLDEQSIEQAADLVVTARKVYVAGNGGSASTAKHFALALKWAGKEAYSLIDNVTVVTALANDYGYENVFKKQLENTLGKDDLVIAISGSGGSENVIRSVEYANEIGAVTLGILGFNGGRLRNIVNKYILVENHDYGQVEDIHLAICHMITYLVKGRNQ
ncbi:SIS domain-containing protein [Chloroflexota bacterium]